MASHRTRKPVTFREEIPEDIWCRYCNNIYEDPRLLPCLHSLCKKCLTAIQEAQKEEIACPVCLTEVTCRLEGLLPNSQAKHKLKEWEKRKAANRREPCGGCEVRDNLAMSKCLQCEEFLCDECIQAHQRVKFTKNHDILSLQELADKEAGTSNEENSEVFCHKHERSILNRFCVECDVAACSDCIKESHRNPNQHTIVTIPDALDSAKVELKETLNTTRKKIPVLQKSVYEVIKRYGRVQTKAEEITWQIRQTSRHLIQAVKAREHQLLGELHALQERRSTGLVQEKEIMERKLVRTIDGCDFTDGILKEGRDAEILMVKKICTERLELLQEEKTDSQIDKVKLTFEPEEEPIVRAIKNAFGRLLVLNAPPATGSDVNAGTNEQELDGEQETTSGLGRSEARGGSVESLDDQEHTKGLGESSKSVSFSEPALNENEKPKSKPDKSRSRRFSLPLLMGKKPAEPVGKTSPTKFTLATADHKGRRKEVQVQLESPDGSVISAHVLDNKDGTYTIFYCPRTPGEHNVYISLSSQDVKHGQRLLNIYGSLKGMRGEELALACKVLCLIRWQITPGLVTLKNKKVVPNPKMTFDGTGGKPVGVSTA